VPSNVYEFSKTIHGAWRIVDGVISSVNGALRRVSGTFRIALTKFLGH
jgi:hypothetical protein